MVNPQKEITQKKEPQDGTKKQLQNKNRRKRIRRAEYVSDKERTQNPSITYGNKKNASKNEEILRDTKQRLE